MAISPLNNEKTVFYTGKLYGLTGMLACALHDTHVPYSSNLQAVTRC